MASVSPFDSIPDHLLLLIFNKLFHAKSLVRCLSVSKRFASLVPLTDAVFLPLFLPPTTTSSSSHGGSSGNNILKSLFSYVFIKPFRLLRRHSRSLPSDSPTHCPPLLLNTFYHITFLHFELHSYGGSVDADFLKWKATFGSQLKRCVVVCATSFHRGLREGGEEGETTSSALASEDLKSRIMWTISCLIAASARHFLLKQMLLKFPTLKRIVISDSKKQGMFRMEEGELEELRGSLLMEDDGAASFRSEQRVVPDLRMRMWYEPELKLPESGCVMKGATMLVISLAGEMRAVAENGGGGGFDGDEAETAVFGEAEREIAKKKSSHVMEMTSF